MKLLNNGKKLCWKLFNKKHNNESDAPVIIQHRACTY